MINPYSYEVMRMDSWMDFYIKGDGIRRHAQALLSFAKHWRRFGKV